MIEGIGVNILFHAGRIYYHHSVDSDNELIKLYRSFVFVHDSLILLQRGMGAGAVGSSLSLIAPAEDKAHIKIMGSLSVPFHKVLLDGRLLTSSQERVSLASKIYTAGEMEQKTNSHNRWFQEMAKVADLDLDDDMMEDENNRSEKEQLSLLEAKRARGQLARLLQEPMRTQKFGKFLSTNSAALQNQLKQPLSK